MIQCVIDKLVDSADYVIVKKVVVNYQNIKQEIFTRMSDIYIYEDQNENVHELYRKLFSKLNEIILRNTYNNSTKIKTKFLLTPWVNVKIANLIKLKNSLWKHLKSKPWNNFLRNRFERLNDIIKHCLKNAKTQYYKNKLNHMVTFLKLGSLLMSALVIEQYVIMSTS